VFPYLTDLLMHDFQLFTDLKDSFQETKYQSAKNCAWNSNLPVGKHRTKMVPKSHTQVSDTHKMRHNIELRG
jgi:hypothetical protein